MLWHLARVQDHHIADLAGQPQVWATWQQRFGLDNGIDDVGYGHTSEQVDAIRIEDVELLTAYHHEVTLATARYLGGVDEQELEREVDQSWDPPVTAGVRLISILADCLQHLGQAAYVKGSCRPWSSRRSWTASTIRCTSSRLRRAMSGPAASSGSAAR